MACWCRLEAVERSGAAGSRAPASCFPAASAWPCSPHRWCTPGAPALDLGLFGSRPFTEAAVSLFLSGLSMYGATLLLPLYYQQVRGAGVLGTGLLLAPQGISRLLPRTVAGRLTDRAGPRPVVLAGIVAAALGTLPFALAGAHTSEPQVSAALVVRGAGLSTAMIALMVGAYQGLAKQQVPDASSATQVL